MYKNTPWLDQIVDSETQEIIQVGTNQSAANFNNMEGGITDAYIALAMLQVITGDLNSKTKVIEGSYNTGESKTHPYPSGFTKKNCVIISKMGLENGVAQDIAEIQDNIKITLSEGAIVIRNASTTTSYDVRVVLLRI